jgi:hypothetical protein
VNPEAQTELVQAAAMMIAVAITSTGRPFLTLFLLLGVPTLLVDTNLWTSDQFVLPTAQVWVLAVLGVLAVVEHVARGRALYAEAIERLPWDRLLVNGIIWVMYLHQVDAASTPAELARAAAPHAPLLVGSASVHLAAGFARTRALDLLRSVGIGGVAHWIESFGVVGIVIVAVFLPILALLLAGIALVPVVGGVLAARFAEHRIDQGRRRACPSCGHAARMEASVCPSCRAPLTVTRTLAAPR